MFFSASAEPNRYSSKTWKSETLFSPGSVIYFPAVSFIREQFFSPYGQFFLDPLHEFVTGFRSRFAMGRRRKYEEADLPGLYLSETVMYMHAGYGIPGEDFFPDLMHLLQGHVFIGRIFYGRNFLTIDIVGPHLAEKDAVGAYPCFTAVFCYTVSHKGSGDGPVLKNVFKRVFHNSNKKYRKKYGSALIFLLPSGKRR